ncbi:MAG: thiamine pyrophosphate-requiring protein [Qingshengfaniella sp.]
MTEDLRPGTGAEAVLLGLKAAGVDYLFANAGTDFPPIIEALSTLAPDTMPQPVTIPHETAAIGMAHGYYLATGQMQAVMVHVNVGLANAVMGVLNAASDNVPVIVMSGRTPLTEVGRAGSRASPIQYGQEMYDQAGLVSDVVKFHYELRYPEQAGMLVTRAATLAGSAPEGPVYLSLPREALTETIPAEAEIPANPQAPSRPAQADPQGLAQLADWLSRAQSPLIVTQRGDPQGRLGPALTRFANRFAVAVTEPFSIRNVMAWDDPMFAGHDPAAVRGADLVIVLDADVPWIEKLHAPGPGTRIVHIGPDPQFGRMPVRGYRTDLAITADPALALEALTPLIPQTDVADRHATLTARSANRRDNLIAAARTGANRPMSAEWLSLCLAEALPKDALVFSELGALPGLMRPSRANQIFANPHSGGLGWALPAALGAQLADRDRMVTACVGDGSYMFANPTACHQIAEALRLPVLTIVKNNGLWNAVRRSVKDGYPDGAAARANVMPLTSLQPAPDYLKVAEASRAHTERVRDGRDLPDALDRALHIIRSEGRQAMLEVEVAVSDRN